MERCLIQTPLGDMTLLTDEQAILGLWFNDQRYFGAHYELNAVHTGTSPVSRQVQRWMDAYFADQHPTLDGLSFAPQGTPFQQTVWQAMDTIAYGSVLTYGELASRVAKPQGYLTSPRAVGAAVGRNPISLLRPCHRVVGGNGALTGYAGGLERKAALLRLEESGRLFTS